MVVPIIIGIAAGFAILSAMIFGKGAKTYIDTQEKTSLIKAEKADVSGTDIAGLYKSYSIDLDAVQGSNDVKKGYLVETPNFTIQSGDSTPTPTSAMPKDKGGTGSGDSLINFGNTFNKDSIGNIINIILIIIIIMIIITVIKRR